MAVADTLTSAFFYEAAFNPPTNLEKIYTALSDPNLLVMQNIYDYLFEVSADNATATLRTIAVDEDHPVFLVCSAASTQHPKPIVHFLTGLYLLNNLIHPLHNSVPAWVDNPIEADLPATINFDPL